MNKPSARFGLKAMIRWWKGAAPGHGIAELITPSGPTSKPDALAAIRSDFHANAAQMLVEIEDALAATDLRAADQGLHALKLAAQKLGYPGLARAAQTGRGILGMAPGLDIVALRKTLDVTNAVAQPAKQAPAYSDLRSPPLRAMAIDQEQYWTAIEMHIQLQSSERPQH